MSTQREDDIKQLNSFLRGERSAVETYRQAADKVDEAPFKQRLLTLCASHEKRVEALSAKIRELGGSPSNDSGTWGAFAKLVEGGAKLFGDSAALAALEEGEDHGRDDYRRDVESLSPELQQFVRGHLLPEQKRTHDELNALKKAV